MMQICKTISEIRQITLEIKNQQKSIGLVPTMGYLHDGHLALIEKSQQLADYTIVSIFVNPTQFNNEADFSNYPQNLDRDLEILQKQGVNLVFTPAAEEVYAGDSMKIQMQIPHLMQNLCAASRPGHFEGVMTIVAKLFHYSRADHAVFGKKDYQQYLIIKEMVRELSFPTQIHGVETKREADGLAMSSRNARLTEKQRQAAGLIPRAYHMAKKQWQAGERQIALLKSILSEILLSSPLIKIDYLEMVHPETLAVSQETDKEVLIALAIFVDEIRLIDNRILAK